MLLLINQNMHLNTNTSTFETFKLESRDKIVKSLLYNSIFKFKSRNCYVCLPHGLKLCYGLLFSKWC